MKKLKTSVSIVWFADDILHQAKEMNVKLTKEEVSDVLELLGNEHDACIGINWDTIQYQINRVIEERL